MCPISLISVKSVRLESSVTGVLTAADAKVGYNRGGRKYPVCWGTDGAISGSSSSAELLEAFLAVKRLEGRSDKTLALYRYNIGMILDISGRPDYNQPSHPPQLKHPLQRILNEHSSHLSANWGT